MSWNPVFRFVQRIPRGRVLTYGALAKALRLPGGARSAGRAMAATPSGKGIPWHRVVGERGKILIREPYASLQKKLLESEGVKITESRVDLKSHLWAPSGKGRRAQKPTRASRAKGEVVRLLGPNGAGKTTTVEILEGLRNPDGGYVRVCGLDPQVNARELKHEIGAALQSTSLPEKLKVMEALRLFAGFYK